MKLIKYPQACVLIETKEKRILIDPGYFVYEHTNLTPDTWEGIDVLLLTHEHEDHADPEAVRTIVERNTPIVLTNAPVQKMLKEKLGIDADVLLPGEERSVAGCSIRGVQSLHGPLPNGDLPPEVIGFLIDNTILHPGDTVYIDPQVQAEVLLLPMCDTVTFSPNQAAAYALRLQPKLVIPIHYHNERFLRDTSVMRRALQNVNVPYKIMADQEEIEL
ncbi:MAG: MBL fold metallo-hydrolase [bacterium]|nr:MBL fold metallo-hydrolase [bacterium]